MNIYFTATELELIVRFKKVSILSTVSVRLKALTLQVVLTIDADKVLLHFTPLIIKAGNPCLIRISILNYLITKYNYIG